jgi:sporadic carbohydrate cluster protein (TIGR04323 family)
VSTSERKGYRGYVSARPFGGYNIPVPIQNLVLRDYCTHNKLFFMLPVNENIFPHSYMVLDGLIRDLSAFEGVVMCSMHMLPAGKARRQAVIRKILDQGCVLHFALEATVVTTPKDAERVEDLVVLTQASAKEKQLQALRAVVAETGEPALED